MNRAVLALVVASSGCGVQVTGDFDGIPFVPDTSLIAVADTHDLLLHGGAVIPVTKNPAGQTVQLLLSAARVDVARDWRHDTADNILEIKRELATSDGLLLKNIPMVAFDTQTPVVASIEEGVVRGDFDLAIGTALPDAAVVQTQGLGSKLTVTLSPGALSISGNSGSVSADIEIQREREAGQDGDIATGTVNLVFTANLSPERLGEANLTLAEPVIRCMMSTGPSRAGGCREVDELPYVDETGVVDP